MTVFEKAGDRVLVLPRSDGWQPPRRSASLRRRAAAKPPQLDTVPSMFDVANLVGRRDARPRASPRAASRSLGPAFQCLAYILGGEVAGQGKRLFRIYAEGNFIEAGTDASCLQTGEAK